MFVATPGMFVPDIQRLVADIRDFGGSPSSSASVNSTAYSSAVTALGTTGGIIYFGPGTYSMNANTLSSNIFHQGEGPGVSILQLAAGQNTDLFSAQTNLINLSASQASSSNGTLSNFGFYNLTLDGNSANQTSGPCYPLRFYGYDYVLENVIIQNGYSGGVLCDWNGSAIHTPQAPDGVEARWKNVKIHDASGIGLQIGGPHDSQFEQVIIFSSNGMNLHIAPNASGLQFTDFHSWGQFLSTVPGVLIEAGNAQFENAVLETSSTTTYALIVATQQCDIKGKMLGTGTCNGIKLGQNSGETPVPGQILQSAGVTLFNDCLGGNFDLLAIGITGSHGAVQFDEAHYNKIKVVSVQSSGNVATGFLDPTNQYELLAPSGLTPDGSVGKGGQTRISADSNNAFTVGGAGQYLDYFNVSTHSNPRFEMPNGVYLQFYTDQYSTATSAIRVGTGAPSNGTGANGDYYFRSDGGANTHIYFKSSGSWAGII